MPYTPAQIYAPAEDTHLLCSAAHHEVRPTDHVLEVGTGSGIIAAELSKVAACVVATDINPSATVHAHAHGIDVIRTDLFAGLKGLFDLVVFNPPYLPTKADERIDDWLEYALDGGNSGRVVIGRFAVEVSRVLAPKGRILVLISSMTGLPEVLELFEKKGYPVTIIREKVVEDETLYVLRMTMKFF